MTYSRDFLTTANQSFQIAPLLPGVPVLDQDINLMQNAGFEQLRESLKARVPSGFLDEIESEPIEQAAHNTSATKCLYTMPGKDVIFIRGNQRLVIDGMPVVLAHCAGGSSEAGSTSYPHSAIQMAALPASTFQPANGVTSRKGSRVDMVILEVWRKEITTPASTATADRRLAGLTDAGNFFPFGNTQPMTAAGTLTNDMVDPAVGGETSRRIQIQYRLRVVEDVNPHGSAHPMVAQATPAWPSHKRTSADGVAASSYNFAAVATDAGFYRAGDGSSGAKTALNTFDGYVYALPIAIVGRRNSSAWSMENMNGSTGRVDGRTANVHFTDIVDFRHNVKIDNNWDYKAMYEKNLDKILSCQLRTTFEEWMMNSDGDSEFNAAGIIGTRLLRVEGLTGTAAPVNDGFQQTWQLQHNKVAQNGVRTSFDGMRNYYSDVGGDQAIKGLIPNIGADGVSGGALFGYVASTKTLTLDATNMLSNDGVHASRTKVSTRQPHVRWGANSTSIGTGAYVSGTWTGLGGDSASFVMSDKTYFHLVLTAPTSNYAVGDTYTSTNGVICTVEHSILPAGRVAMSYTGAVIPACGNFTRTTGSGDVTFTQFMSSSYAVRFKTNTNISTLKKGDIYTCLNGFDISINRVIDSTTFDALHATSSATAPSTTGVFTKVSGTGPASLNITFIIAGSYQESDIAYPIGYPLMPANAPIHINAYATFAPGSGFLSRIPHNNNHSFIGCHFNVNGTQVLPNNGVGFIPFGSTVDPVNDGNLPVDSHSRTSSLMGFLYKGAVMNIGTESHGYNSSYSCFPSVIKDGSTYKMWFTGGGTNYRILYATSTDGIVWSTPQLAMDIDTEPNGYNSARSYTPSVIKDGSTYKMWFTGYNGTNYRILYSESTDGTTWSTPALAMNIDTEPSGYNVHSTSPSVIKDGSTYKMWFTGSTGANARILYATSTDGIVWSTPQLAMNSGTEPNGYNSVNSDANSVIKDGTAYKMWFSGYIGTNYRILYATSTDGIVWSTPQLAMDIGTEPNGYDSVYSYSPSVIKDGSTYKMWFTGGGTNFRILHAVLTMTDTANTGSSTTGVYSTTGSLNHAPPANSQVVVMYEALANQNTRSLLNAPIKLGPVYIPAEQGFVTSLGTGHTAVPVSNILSRDVVAEFGTYAYKPYDLTGLPLLQDSITSFASTSSISSTTMGPLSDCGLKVSYQPHALLTTHWRASRLINRDMPSLSASLSNSGVGVQYSGTATYYYGDAIPRGISGVFSVHSILYNLDIPIFNNCVMGALSPSGGTAGHVWTTNMTIITPLGRPILK